MTEFTQRVSTAEEFKNPIMVSFKTDLVSKFYDLAGKTMKNVGAHYFAHQLIKNFCQKEHAVSSFVTNPDWQEKYWKDYWDCDPLVKSSYKIAKVNGCAITSWKVADFESDCMEDRMSMCQIRDGLSFWMEHDSGIIENFSFGWEKYDVTKVNRQKLAELYNMITDFRIQHYRLNRDMFPEGYPSVNFY